MAARDAEQLLTAAEARGSERWIAFLRPLPEQLRDAGLADLRRVAMRARAAYGPKDSIRDALPGELTESFLDHIDRLLKAIARDAVEAVR